MLGADPLRVSVGFEARGDVAGDGVGANVIDSNYIDLRLSVDVPIDGGAGVSVGASFPLYGDHGASLNLSGDWSLLLPTR